jgi:hypothetical protein
MNEIRTTGVLSDASEEALKEAILAVKEKFE